MAFSRRRNAWGATMCVVIWAAMAGAAAAGEKAMTAHDFTFRSIDGDPLALSGFAGKAVLVVNTASECGFTPQYAGLQALWERHRDKGLIVLGVPSNDFGGQEPGEEAEIKQFCELNYGVDFPLTEKVKVIGSEAHPFYRWIADELGEDQAPRWNFHKYLIAPDGTLAGAWPSRVTPDAAEIASAIDASLD